MSEMLENCSQVEKNGLKPLAIVMAAAILSIPLVASNTVSATSYEADFDGQDITGIEEIAPPSNDAAEAAKESPIMPKRLYLGASIGVSRLDPIVENTPFLVTDRVDAALSLLAGFHITPRLMAQFSFSDAGFATVENSVTGLASDIDYHIWSADLQYYLWQNYEGLAFFGGAGATYIDNSSDIDIDKKDNIQLKVKAGFDYSLTSDVWLRTQYESFSGDAQILSLGILKYFGGPKQAVAEACEVSGICDDDNPNGDDDGDGVVNRSDKCPNTLPGLKVDENGCALFNKTYTNVLFEFDEYTLTPVAVDILNEMISELDKVPNVKISIAAHTDSIGTIAYNDWLSVKRARAIVDYLIAGGIDHTRLEGRGYGEKYPVANNNSSDGQALNRRAEFKIIVGDDVDAY